VNKGGKSSLVILGFFTLKKAGKVLLKNPLLNICYFYCGVSAAIMDASIISGNS